MEWTTHTHTHARAYARARARSHSHTCSHFSASPPPISRKQIRVRCAWTSSPCKDGCAQVVWLGACADQSREGKQRKCGETRCAWIFYHHDRKTLQWGLFGKYMFVLIDGSGCGQNIEPPSSFSLVRLCFIDCPVTAISVVCFCFGSESKRAEVRLSIPVSNGQEANEIWESALGFEWKSKGRKMYGCCIASVAFAR